MAFFAIIRKSYTEAGRNLNQTYVNVVEGVRERAGTYADLINTAPWNDPTAANFTVELTEAEHIALRDSSDRFHDGQPNLPKWQQRWGNNSGVSGETAQVGAATTITLAATQSAVDDQFNDMEITILSGTGAAQTRTISDYVGSTKVATVSVAWTTAPDATSVYEIIAPKQFGNWSDPTDTATTWTNDVEVPDGRWIVRIGDGDPATALNHLATLDLDEDQNSGGQTGGRYLLNLRLYNADDTQSTTNVQNAKTLIAGKNFIFDFTSGLTDFLIDTTRAGNAVFPSNHRYRVVGPNDEKEFTATIFGRVLRTED